MTDFKTPIKTSLSQLSKPLTDSLRKDAVKAGWPKEYANALQVLILNGDITIKYPKELETAIEDLEYGTKVLPPIPVLRKFIDRYTVDIINDIMDSSVLALIKADVIP